MIVNTPKVYYEIEALEERPNKPPVINFGRQELPPPKPVVFHCRCDKWWVITEHLFCPLCPSCGAAMSACIDFEGCDYRYGDYGEAAQYEIIKKRPNQH